VKDLKEPKSKKGLWVSIACIAILIFIDQWFKVHIKTTMTLHTEVNVLGEWFRLHFTENPGMAFGLELKFLGQFGKIALTLFRLVAVVFGFFILIRQANKGAHKGLLISISLILAGAIGNLVDSIFYGVIFEQTNNYIGGYFHGHVVDMLYFPMMNGHYWDWIPKIGGQNFTFFSPVFNLADSFISTGAIAIFIFQRWFFKKEEESLPTNIHPVSSIEEETTEIVEEVKETSEKNTAD